MPVGPRHRLPTLYLNAKPIDRVFALLGTKENDITYSLGWACRNARVCASGSWIV